LTTWSFRIRSGRSTALTAEARMAETEAFRNLPEEKRARVFAAAAAEFASRGYEAASMNALVGQAAISKGSLFVYFPTKLDLFDTVVTRAVKLAKDRLREVRDDTAFLNLAERLAGVLRAGFRFVDDHPHLARIYFRLLQGETTPFRAKRLQVLHRQSLDYLHDLLADARARGEVRGDLDLRQASFLIHGLLQQLLRAYDLPHVDSGLGLHHCGGANRETWIATTTQLITDGVVPRGRTAHRRART
jgi:AcrR family transcriptional regulator